MVSEEGLAVWKALKTPAQRTLLDMMKASRVIQEPTPDLLRVLPVIANKLANHPNFMYYENLDEMRNEAVVQMIKLWDKCNMDRCSTEAEVFAFFYQIAVNTFHHAIHSEARHRNIQFELLRSAKDGTLEFYYRP